MANQDNTLKQTLVAEGTELKGNLKSSWPVVVHGTIDGKVDAPELTITRAGSVLGAIKANKLRSHGTLSGNVDAGDVFLSGAVRSNTIIRANTLELKLGSPAVGSSGVGSSEKGGLEVIFGESNILSSSAAERANGANPDTAIVDGAAKPDDDWSA